MKRGPAARSASGDSDAGNGGFGPGAAALLAALLAGPALALWRFTASAGHHAWLLVPCVASVLAYAATAVDKHRARNAAARIPESTLHGLALLGGWPGAFVAQRRHRHKTSKWRFQAVFWLIVAGHQFVAWDGLCDWELSRRLAGWGGVVLGGN